jgi:cellulose synthase (UDP-forming)
MTLIELPGERTLIVLGVALSVTVLGLAFTLAARKIEPHRRKTAGFRIISSVNILLATYYLSWRYLYSLNADALWLAIPLVLAETYAYIDSILFMVMMWKPIHRTKAPPLIENARVDVFITSFNEPVELVRMTVEAAMRIDWPLKRVYILDDGDRPEFEKLAEECSCNYITRGREWDGKPRHAKAGNVNNALQQTSGEFILILDADQIPAPEIIRHIIGYFRDEKVAFVQTPQHFYNLPPGDPFGADAPLFYGPILEGKDGWNAAFFCGSNAILRREALLQLGIIEYVKATAEQAAKAIKDVRKEIKYFAHKTEACRLFAKAVIKSLDRGKKALQRGTAVKDVHKQIRQDLRKELSLLDANDSGLLTLSEKVFGFLDVTRRDEAFPILPISTISVTEDMATSIRFHRLGWRSVFHSEILAYGLSPEDLGSALIQRLRWAQGTIQVLVKENPLFAAGLSPAQRLQYFTTIYSYFSGFATAVFILSPVVFLFTGIPPVKIYSPEFIWRLIPFLFFNRLMFKFISWGTNVKRGEQYSAALFPIWIQAVTGVLLGKNPRFAVTPKARQSGIYLRAVRFQILAVALSIGGSVYCFSAYMLGRPINLPGMIVNIFWAVYNSVMLLNIIKAAVYRLPEGWEAKPPEHIVPRV